MPQASLSRQTSLTVRMEPTTDRTGAAHRGFVLSVSGAKRPAFRWEVAPDRLRLVVGEQSRLWARSELSWWRPPWFAHRMEGNRFAVVPPIRATELRAIRAPAGSVAWNHAWMRWFVEEIRISRCSPLYNGTWRLAQLKTGLLEKSTAWGYLPWDGVPTAHSIGTLHAAWRVWCATKERCAQGEVVMLRHLTGSDIGRAKMWRKRAMENRLPPVFVMACVLPGIHVVLDGHVRLYAALEAGKTPELIVLFPALVQEKRLHDDWRAQALRQAEIDLTNLTHPGSYVIDRVNAKLIDAFDEGIVYTPRLRGWKIPGGADEWAADLEEALRGVRDPIVVALRDEMVRRGNVAGRMLSRKRTMMAMPDLDARQGKD